MFRLRLSFYYLYDYTYGKLAYSLSLDIGLCHLPFLFNFLLEPHV